MIKIVKRGEGFQTFHAPRDKIMQGNEAYGGHMALSIIFRDNFSEDVYAQFKGFYKIVQKPKTYLSSRY